MRPIKAAKRAREAFRLLNTLRKLKEGDMLKGKKTYIGIAIVAVAFFMNRMGVGGEAEATELVTTTAELVGILVAAYGRYAAKPS